MCRSSGLCVSSQSSKARLAVKCIAPCSAVASPMQDGADAVAPRVATTSLTKRAERTWIYGAAPSSTDAESWVNDRYHVARLVRRSRCHLGHLRHSHRRHMVTRLGCAGNSCQCQRNDATYDRCCHAPFAFRTVVFFLFRSSYLCYQRLCAAHIPCSSCAAEDEERPLLGWLPLMLQSLHCALVYLQRPGACAWPSRFSDRAHSSRTTLQSHLVFLLDPSHYIRDRCCGCSTPQSPR